MSVDNVHPLPGVLHEPVFINRHPHGSIVDMRIDHVAYAAGYEGLDETADRIAALLGVEVQDGGFHPRFGTRNKIVPLCDGRYVEVVEVLEHPAAEKAPFGQAVRARSDMGGGWMGWVVATENLDDVEDRLGREAVDGQRRRPDGVVLQWRQIGINGLMADPQLPFIIKWETPEDLHPSRGGRMNGVRMDELKIAGDPDRVLEWLGIADEFGTDGVSFDFMAPHGTPGIMSVTFVTPQGRVEI